MEINKKIVRLPWVLSFTKVNSSTWMRVTSEMRRLFCESRDFRRWLELSGINRECVTMGKRNRVAFTRSYAKVTIAIESVKSPMTEKNECKFLREGKISFTGHTDIVSLYTQEKDFCELGIHGQCATRKCLLLLFALSFSLTF